MRGKPDHSMIAELADKVIGMPIGEADALVAKHGFNLYVKVSEDFVETGRFSQRPNNFNVASRRGRITRFMGVG